MNRWKLVGLFALLALVLVPLCGAVGFSLGAASNGGSLTRWRRLPDAPEKPVHLVGGSVAAVFVAAADETVYLCNHRDGPCWEQYDQPVDPSTDNDYCAQYPNHYSVSAPPGAPVDTLSANWCHFEAGEQSNYALLSDGSVWLWNHGDYGLGSLVNAFGAMLGGVCLGLLGAVAVPVGVWVRGKAEGRRMKDEAKTKD